MRVFKDLAELSASVGEELGVSEWHEVTQEQVNQFAEATGDHQWIHVDPEKAAQGPFGRTIAHGYLTVSLIPMLSAETYKVESVKMGVNYGSEKVRFPAPLPVGSRVRGRATLVEVVPVALGQRVAVDFTLEVEGGDKPVCVARTLAIFAE
ncbi:MaoC family dehydratase [Mumia zhuanghuii]|uniref:MaoC family dehydratase n=2 Tax=Mumia TaxID=1546255 RepID=A0ABW1QSB3_9ACTN|nr:MULTISPECIES: MaoC family dehydratase [Mumia]KAA1424514.1 MaoC family dehydratase [Mumia zhuanghuii]